MVRSSASVLPVLLRAALALLALPTLPVPGTAQGLDPPERPAAVIVVGPDGAEVRLDAQLRTRGNFRRERANCHMPPLRLNLKKGQVAGTVFEVRLARITWLDTSGERELRTEPSLFIEDADAPYATPDAEMGIRTVRERRYLGWCRSAAMAHEVLEEFRGARETVRRTVLSFEHLDEGRRDDIADFLEPFHRDIETDRRAELTFLGLCRTMPPG